MDIQELDLNGGTFKLNLPYNWVGWLLWAIGLILTIVGIVVAVNRLSVVNSECPIIDGFVI